MISVVPLLASGPRSPGPVAGSDVEEHGRELDEAVERLKGLGVAAKTIEAAGHIAGTIVDEADRGGFDLIVIGASGHHGIECFVGSTTTRVVSPAPPAGASSGSSRRGGGTTEVMARAYKSY